MAEVTEKETEPIKSEKWIGLPTDFLGGFNQDLANTGNSGAEVFHICLLLQEVPMSRIRQVTIALKNAAAATAADQIIQKGNGHGLGTLSASTENDAFIAFVRSKGEEDDKTIQSINGAVRNANEILEAFDKPKIPNFTLQTTIPPK